MANDKLRSAVFEKMRRNLFPEQRASQPQSAPDIGLNSLQVVGSAGIPGVSDLAGVIGDIQMFRNQPETLTLENVLMSGAGVLPLVPAAGVLRKSKKLAPGYYERPVRKRTFGIEKIEEGQDKGLWKTVDVDNPMSADLHRTKKDAEAALDFMEENPGDFQGLDVEP